MDDEWKDVDGNPTRQITFEVILHVKLDADIDAVIEAVKERLAWTPERVSERRLRIWRPQSVVGQEVSFTVGPDPRSV